MFKPLSYGLKAMLICSLTALSGAFLTSCGEDEPEEDSKGLFSNGGTVNVEYNTTSFTVYANRDITGYDISSSSYWVTGEGVGASVALRLQQNTSSSSRSADLYIRNPRNGIVESSLHVIQDCMPGSSDNNQGGNTGGNQGGNTGGNQGGNTGGNQGGNTGGNQGGNTGGNTQSKPNAPTGVTVNNYGSVNVPDVRITWNAVSGATNYRVYRSMNANGSYSMIGSTSNEYFAEPNRLTLGKTYYYKVSASNSVGESEKSDYAAFEYADTRKPGSPEYGNCSVSTNGYMTINWRIPTGGQYGVPTKHILRVYDPTHKEYVDWQTLSGTATSASFAYGIWADNEGYIRCGIIAENNYGSSTKGAIIYNYKTKEWFIP